MEEAGPSVALRSRDGAADKKKIKKKKYSFHSVSVSVLTCIYSVHAEAS